MSIPTRTAVARLAGKSLKLLRIEVISRGRRLVNAAGLIYRRGMKALSFFLVLTAAAFPMAVSAQMHAPPPMSKAQFESTPAGSPVQIVVRVTTLQREALAADLLAQVDASHYKPTGTHLNLYFPAQTPVLMGSAGDVKPGALLYVYAVATSRDRADVKKIVVVTPYATVL